MNEVCQQYMSNVKAFFPIMGKTEREYLRKLSVSVEECCEEKAITTVEELYDEIGSPGDVFNTYFSQQNMSQIIRRIRQVKWIKRGIMFILIIALIGTGVFVTRLYQTCQELQDTCITDGEMIIE